MKKFLTAVALSAVALGVQAQVTFTGGAARTSFANYDPTGPAGTLAPTGGREDATINTTAGTLTATFLGFEALNRDTFTFSLANATLNNRMALGSTIAGFVNAGMLNFTFADMTGGSVGNGGNPGVDFNSYAVLGDFSQTGVFTPDTLGGTYDLILGFNDGLRVDADYDDIVIGLRIVPIPEPETYALMLAGLGALGFISRRRRKL